MLVYLNLIGEELNAQNVQMKNTTAFEFKKKLSFLMLRLKFIHEWMHSTSYLMGKLHTVDHWLFHNFQQ